MQTRESLVQSVLTLLDEAFQGPQQQYSWFTDVNPKAGLLGTLEQVSHQQASKPPGPGRATIAAHTEHVRYALELANRWFQGENPYDSADWGAAWAAQSVDEAAWDRLRAAVAEQYRLARQAIENGTRWPEGAEGLTGVLAMIAHTAYHLGAIRQMVKATQG